MYSTRLFFIPYSTSCKESVASMWHLQTVCGKSVAVAECRWQVFGSCTMSVASLWVLPKVCSSLWQLQKVGLQPVTAARSLWQLQNVYGSCKLSVSSPSKLHRNLWQVRGRLWQLEKVRGKSMTAAKSQWQ